jgi:hypothetical protein
MACSATQPCRCIIEASLTHRRATRWPMLTEEDIAVIRQRIVDLQGEHRDLDVAIATLSTTPGHDELHLRRLKKKKLQLKDTVTLLEMRLIPDIPA